MRSLNAVEHVRGVISDALVPSPWIVAVSMSSDNPISIPLGIIIGLLSSCVQSLGLTIQRKSHVLNQSLPEHLQRVEHRRPYVNLGCFELLLFLMCLLQLVAVRFRSFYIIQHPRFICTNRITSGRHPCPARRRLSALERLLCPLSARRCLLSMDGTRHYLHHWRRHSDRHFWNCTRADSFLGRSTRTLQTTHLHCIFLHARFCLNYIFNDRKSLHDVQKRATHHLTDTRNGVLSGTQNLTYLSFQSIFN